MNLIEKSEGFIGQRIVVLPRPVVARAQNYPLINVLFPTDVGYFPHATGHLRERPKGADQAIFIYCTKGSGWCELAERHFDVRAGELLVVPPQIPHIYGATASLPWTIHWFHVIGTQLGLFLNELNVDVNSPVVQIGEDSHLLALFEELLDVMQQGYTTLHLIYASKTLAHLLADMIQDHRSDRVTYPTTRQKVAQTISYMKQHLNHNMQLDTLARVASLSRSQYVALFKKQTGYTPVDYFIRLRMHRACQLLDTTDLPIKSVAEELGFEDPLYFSRSFRLINKATPTEYRKQRKG